MRAYFTVVGFLFSVTLCYAQGELVKGIEAGVRTEPELAQTATRILEKTGKEALAAISLETPNQNVMPQPLERISKHMESPAEILPPNITELENPWQNWGNMSKAQAVLKNKAVQIRQVIKERLRRRVTPPTTQPPADTPPERAAQQPSAETEAAAAHIEKTYPTHKMSSTHLRLALLEEHALPVNWESYSRDELEKVLISYRALKSAARQRPVEQPSLFPFIPDNYMGGKKLNLYNEPFHPSVQSLRILVVRDTPDALWYQGASDDSSVKIEWVYDIKGAKREIAENQYDIMLVDLALLEGNGFQVAQYATENKPDMPIVWYSGDTFSAQRLFEHHVIGEVTVPAEDDDAQRIINYLSNIVATGKAYPNKRYDSPLRDFLKEKPVPPEWSQTETPEEWRRRAALEERATPSKRTRESLELELKANGILPRDFETYTNVQLEELLKSYKAKKAQVDLLEKLKTTTPVSDRATSWSRNDELFRTNNAKQILKWAENQPDFYEDNYWPDNYQEPFNPELTSLRVLLISDDNDIISLFSHYSQEGKDITVVHGGQSSSAGISHLKNSDEKYDIIVTDFTLTDIRGGYDVSRYVWNNELDIPVVLLSKDPMGSSKLLLHNFVGQVPYPVFPEQYDAVFNYLSNIVATGKAYPNK